jgi:predicted GNAT superfamily acetyltransferase
MSQARETTPSAEDAGYTIRHCENLQDFDACIELQVKTWGKEDTDAISRSGFLIAHSTGGQVLGAWKLLPDGAPRLIGVALAYMSVVNGEVSLYSHMLAVDSAYRNLGVGRALKLAQRHDALQRGIERIEWTFDPLEIKNAFLNITRLGAVARRYKPDYYGDSASPLHGGLPTDRLIAEWWLDAPRVHQALNGDRFSVREEERITVPSTIIEWKSHSATRPLALALQQQNAEKFQSAFARGLSVVGFVRDEQGNGVFQLGPWAR